MHRALVSGLGTAAFAIACLFHACLPEMPGPASKGIGVKNHAGAAGRPVDTVEGCLPSNSSKAQDDLILGILYEADQDVDIGTPGGAQIQVSPVDQFAFSQSSVFEGTHSFCISTPVRASWWVALDGPRDFSAFQGGWLDFALKSAQGVDVELQWRSALNETLKARVHVAAPDPSVLSSDGWQWVSIPLCEFAARDTQGRPMPVDLGKITSLAGFSSTPNPSDSAPYADFCVDALRWRKHGTCAAATCNAPVLGTAGATGSGGTFSAVDLAPWLDATCVDTTNRLAADDYLYGVLFDPDQELDLDVPGGAQILLSPQDTFALISGPAANGSSAKCVDTDTLANWWVDLGTERDMSAFRGGRVEFELQSTDAIDLELQWQATTGKRMKARVASSAFESATPVASGWKTISIPLCEFRSFDGGTSSWLPIDLSRIVSLGGFAPHVIVGDSNPRSSYCVAAVRWTKAGTCPKESCVAPPTDVPNGDAGTVLAADLKAWVAPGCVDATDRTALDDYLFGVLFDADQEVDLDVQNGTRILLSPEDTFSLFSGATMAGNRSHCVDTDVRANWWIDLGAPANLSAFRDGRLEFELLSEQPIDVELQWLDVNEERLKARVSTSAYQSASTAADGWQRISIPLCAFIAVNAAGIRTSLDLSRTLTLGGFAPSVNVVNAAPHAHFCVSSVRWSKAGNCPATCTIVPDAGTTTTPDAGTGSSPDLSAWVNQACVDTLNRDAVDVFLWGVMFETDQEVDFDVPGGARILTAPPGKFGLMNEIGIEGSAECVDTDVRASWWIQLDSPTNLSSFVDGRLEFEVLTDGNVDVELHWGDAAGVALAARVHAEDYITGSDTNGQWKRVSIPLCAFHGYDPAGLPTSLDLTKVLTLAGFSGRANASDSAPHTQFCIDALRWTKAGRCPAHCEVAPPPGGDAGTSPVDGGPDAALDGGSSIADWLDLSCVADKDDRAIDRFVYGLLFEADQDLALVGGNNEMLFTFGAIVPDSGWGQHVEGSEATCFEANVGSGWGLLLWQLDGVTQPVDLSSFHCGRIEFELLTDTPVDFQVKWTDGSAREVSSTLRTSTYAVPSRFGGGWLSVSIPLAGFAGLDLSHVLVPALLMPHFVPGTSDPHARFCVDALRWIQGGNCPSGCP